jgi:molecular chaperone DnaK
VLQGDVKGVVLLDVTPLTLSIETLGGVSTPLIERNTTIPAKRSQVFSTAADNPPSVEVHVCQGERSMASDNKSLGRFILDGIPPAPRGIPQIEVTFDIDANGILNVTAKDKGTGKEQKIVIQGSSGMSKEEIEKMQKEAEEHAEEDKKKKETVEARHQLETAILQGEKLVVDAKDKAEEADIRAIEEATKEAKEALEKEGGQKEDYETALKTLMEKMQTVGQKLYEAVSKAEAEKKDETETKKEGEDSSVQEAEVVEKDAEKKDDTEEKK